MEAEAIVKEKEKSKRNPPGTTKLRTCATLLLHIRANSFGMHKVLRLPQEYSGAIALSERRQSAVGTRVQPKLSRTHWRFIERTIDYPYPTAYPFTRPASAWSIPWFVSTLGVHQDQKNRPAFERKNGGCDCSRSGPQLFPMIINSDERQWTWMDEGLNTF